MAKKPAHMRKARAMAMLKRAIREDEIIEKFLSVSDQTLNAREQEFAIQRFGDETETIEDYLIISDPRISPFVDVHCCKSGQFLYSHTDETIVELVRNFGFEKACEYLEIHNRSQVSPVMLRTDTEALRTLLHTNPIAYFIYTASQLLYESTPDSEKFQAVVSARRNFAVHGWMRLPEISRDVLRINEYMRRVMGLASPVFTLEFFTCTQLDKITDSRENLYLFLAELQGVLKHIVSEQLIKTRKKLIARQQVRITDIAEISAKYGGQRRYREQAQYREVTPAEALAYDIESVFMDGDLDLTIHELRFKARGNVVNQPNKNLSYSVQKRIQHEFETTGNVKINLTPKTLPTPPTSQAETNAPGNSDQSPATNPFAQALAKLNSTGVVKLNSEDNEND